MKRDEYLDKVKQVICFDRQDTHGKPENTFELIAKYWSIYLAGEFNCESEVCAADVAAMMALFKIARMQVNPMHSDNVIDAIGYMAIAGELIDGFSGSDEQLNQK